jgi:hypothetical protein
MFNIYAHSSQLVSFRVSLLIFNTHFSSSPAWCMSNHPNILYRSNLTAFDERVKSMN